MDELIGKQKHALPKDNGYYLTNHSDQLEEPLARATSSTAESIEENIISQSLELKDWMPCIQSQPQEHSSADKPKGRTKSNRLHLSSRRSFSALRMIMRLIRRITKRNYLEVLKVELVCYPQSEFLWGGHIDFPKAKDQFHSSIIYSIGWILGKTAQAIAVRVEIDDAVVAEAPLQISRPDVIRAFVSVPGLDSEDPCCGFNIKLNTQKLPDTGHLKFQAILADGNIVSIGFIQFSK